MSKKKQRKAELSACKCLNGLIPYISKDKFKKVTRGDAVSLRIPSTKLEVFRQSIQFQRAWLFNKLPND